MITGHTERGESAEGSSSSHTKWCCMRIKPAQWAGCHMQNKTTNFLNLSAIHSTFEHDSSYDTTTGGLFFRVDEFYTAHSEVNI